MSKPVIVDGKGHLLGRLASICAKELLNGKKLVILRCEKIDVSGSHGRKKAQILSKYRKRTNTNPKKGPFHLKSPSQFFWKTVRGMLPHKTKRGATALSMLKVYDGIPGNYGTMKKMIIPEALRVLRLKQGRKFSNLGLIFTQMGWKYEDLINEKIQKYSVRNLEFDKEKKKK